MPVRPYRDTLPSIEPSAYVDPDAVVIGDVIMAADSSIWPTAVARGDVERIVIGAKSNIQDGSVLHVTHDGPYSPGGRSLIIGEGVTVGHRVTLHACTIGDYCLIGMAALVMDDVVIGPESMIAAGSVVPPGKQIEPRTLWRGSPARPVRDLTEREIENLHYSADHYVRIKNHYLGQ